jgi:hypothetical protein
MNIAADEIARFWAKVDKRGVDDCWPWTGTQHVANREYTPMVYGSFSFRLDGKHKTINAHRLAWIIVNCQSPPAGWVICHKCDEPLCCNPAHLFAGTRADNQRDMQAKLRSGVLGTKNPKAVLTEAQVLEIRRSTESDKVLAERYRVQHWAISDARSGRHWKHLPEANPGFYRVRRKLTTEQVREMRTRRRAGERTCDLAKVFGVSQPTVSQVTRGQLYRHVGE